MAGINLDSLNKGLGIAGGALGMIGAGIEAYKNVPQAASVDPYMSQLNASAIDYQPSSMEGMMMQHAVTPTNPTLTGKDLYDPSAGQVFGSMFGAGMNMYGATKNFTDSLGLQGKMGTTYLGIDTFTAPDKYGNNISHTVSSGYNSATGRGWGYGKGLGKGATGNMVNTAFEAPKIGREVSALNNEVMGSNYMNAWKEGGDSSLPDYQGAMSMHANGGHLFSFGGFDNGAMLGQGINLGMAGLAMGINYAGMQSQKRQAEADAATYNATKAFVDARNQHNFNLAVEDTKNNMFNNQALQMMANGGDLNIKGAEFSLNGGYNFIGNGGSHESNPHNGVTQGIASDGQENLVEEGEVVWNDYVFSRRLTVPEKFRNQYKLKEGITFAEAAQKLTGEAKERPNDPISQNGMEEVLGALQAEQEDVRAKKQAREMQRALKNMTPEELMQLGAMLQQSQAQEQMTPEQGINPEELQGMVAACGGKLHANGGHLYADGGDEVQTRRLLAQMQGDELRELASALQGYDASQFTTTDNNPLIDFIINNTTGDNKYDTIQRNISNAKALKLMNSEKAYDIKDIDMTDWKGLFGTMRGYTESKKRGNTAYKYHDDSLFKYQGKNITELENDPQYQAFKDYVLEHAEDDENVRSYLKLLDDGINTEQGTELLFDNEGKLKSNWKDLFAGAEGEDGKRRGGRSFDQIGGIYHFFQNLKGKKQGDRIIYRLNGQNVEVDDPEKLSKFLKETNRSTESIFDEEGNLMNTHYIDLTGKDYTAAAPNEILEDSPITPLPTLSRYAPVLGSLIGAMQSLTEKPKDYSTNVRPYLPTYQPIGDYLAYNPVDTQRYLLANQRQMAAQRNAIANQSGANRNTAMAQMALANQQEQENMANILNTAEAMNFARRAQVGDFNRGTNMFNAQAFNALQPQMAQRDQLELNQAQHNASTRLHVDEALDAAKGQNLTNLFENLGAIGRENLAYNMANSNKALQYMAGLNGISAHKGACGGMLTKKNRRK